MVYGVRRGDVGVSRIPIRSLPCLGKGGVLTERILLKRAKARDMFAEGIFLSKTFGKNDKFEVADAGECICALNPLCR